jgi:hypothetical protein
MMTSNRIQTVLALAALAITGFAFNVAAEDIPALQPDPENKAVVLDGRNCKWSKKCIGLPSVVPCGNRLAIFYDAPGGDSTSHMNRDVGLAWLDLPLSPPSNDKPKPSSRQHKAAAAK